MDASQPNDSDVGTCTKINVMYAPPLDWVQLCYTLTKVDGLYIAIHRPVFSRISQACVGGSHRPVTGLRQACILAEICKLAQACCCMKGLRQACDTC